jgi:hypothetical protein
LNPDQIKNDYSSIKYRFMKKSNLQFILYILFAILPPFVSEGNDFSRNESCFRFSVETQPDTIIQVSGDEQNQVNLTLPDGALPPVPGVLNIELLRATRDEPQLADGDGWTYAHHMDLAEWRGRLYAAWNMTVKDEDVPPSKVVYATSGDGIEWSKPADLFPRELAWACRFYFYHTKNDKMLTFCAARLSDGNVTEAQKSVLLVREILPDHTLGQVYTLIHPMEKMPPFFETSSDKSFVGACHEAVNNNMLLEQQDYGMFLGDRRMSWHATTPEFNGHYPFGKAFSFYQRQDRQWVGISKMGFVTTSADEGKSWSQPVNPPTLLAGAAKIWGQKTRDKNYMLAYNPDPTRRKRFPLVMVFGNDGIHFSNMRVVHGEYPPLRYPGKNKDFGYQYVRGVAAWSSDHSFADTTAVWMIYSIHKEDIWLSRIPLPAHAEQVSFPSDHFQKEPVGAVVKDWNIYSPKWAPVTIAEESGKQNNRCLELRDGDPTDYARAMRLFPAEKKIRAKFRIKATQTDAPFEIELQDEKGNLFFRISLTKTGELKASSGNRESSIGSYSTGNWTIFEISADANQGTATIKTKEQTFKIDHCGTQNLNKLQRLVFRTGQERKLGDTDALVDGHDKPSTNPALFLLDDVTIKK